ncbi:DUF2294 domain-containing protein [Oscillatoriales cyanobacterium LEGE 11467]|uniref:DUF2294 domain-containing protein n=1 Tax=Zarconia navalis LEGE 11467 TaxID=1828826 RepID=A0A928W144_9CYAN|nr:DUF2294 domain-containing protein [Zarconia navalis]MBE9041953.1 DUF2294 domain-containing protein [Zarconia navalis LEGE 11467]
MNTSELTCGQIEQILSDRIEECYRQTFGDGLKSVSCHLFKATLAIALERSMTPAEELLAASGKDYSAELFRETLHKILQPCIQELVEEVFQTTAIDLLIATNPKTGRTGSIVILEKAPKFQVRSSNCMEATDNKTLS